MANCLFSAANWFVFHRRSSAFIGGCIKWLVVLIGAWLAAHAAAQTYPNKPVRLIVPYPPGGSVDFTGRELAAKLSEVWGQQVVLDNRGFGCINRLQAATGGAPFNNLWKDSWSQTDIAIDFAAHARALGADSCHVDHIAALETALIHARQATKTQVIVIDTDPQHSTSEGGNWWDVAVPEHSDRQDVQQARSHYETSIKNRHAQ